MSIEVIGAPAQLLLLHDDAYAGIVRRQQANNAIVLTGFRPPSRLAS